MDRKQCEGFGNVGERVLSLAQISTFWHIWMESFWADYIRATGLCMLGNVSGSRCIY